MRMQAQRGGGGITVAIVNLGARRGWVKVKVKRLP